MTDVQARLVVTEDGGVTRVQFLDRNILDEGTIQHIGEQLGKLVEMREGVKLLLNFDRVEHLSSAALGTLITLNNQIRQKRGQLRLANIDPQIYEVFVITKLNRIFEIHEDIQKAVASFR